ncbi:Methyltransferase domain-containing protein [Nonomuraea solani]|uniref:Methyltransferase domain-containing protein n=1 Tax=Nonomuraea solani TaxID=1144553 RepID=A0A1H5ZQD2_9ACTN|nr:class I SAM-dependent methyltransferase [Nonomuraea solani]SEG38639.1 Methyltransferase domain-containing protein [Nonomuraea solani]
MEDLFGGAAPYYVKYRAGHGDPAIEHLAMTFGPDATVLDLGCGPGTVAIPLARRVREVLAVDPDEEMLAEGRRLAAKAGNIRWLRGDSTTLADLPPFQHVVMGRSFHWMDRRAVLAQLDELLPPYGVVALIGPSREPVEEAWEPAMRRVRDEFGVSTFTATNSYQATGEHHDDVLATSPFSVLDAARYRERRTYDLDDVLGLQLSYSYTAPARLGDRLGAFTEAARKALLALNPAGTWEQMTVTEVLTARRPDTR